MNKLFLAAMATTLMLASACGPKPAAESSEPVSYIGRSKIKTEHLTPELLQELGRIGDLSPAPDGTKLLFGVTYTSVKKNQSNRNLFIMNADGTGIEDITKSPKSEQNAVWDADSRFVYYLTSESGKMQVWRMLPDGSHRQQVTDTKRDIEGFLLSPDNKRILLIMTLPTPRIDSTLFEGLNKTTGLLVDDMNYRHWNGFVKDYPHPYIAELDAEGFVKPKTLKDIMADEPFECPMRPFGGIESFAWSPDSKQLVYCCRKETGTQYAFSTRSSVYLYDLESGTTTDLHPGDHGYDTNPSFSPDGQWLAFQSMARNGYESDKNRLMLLPLANPEQTTDLTAKYDNNVDQYTWDPTGDGFTFVGYSRGVASVFHLTLEGKVEMLSDGSDHDFGEVCYVGSRLLATRHDWHQPNEIYALDTATHEAVQLTHENDELLAQLGDMGAIQKRWMKCTNGDSMLVWIAFPVGYDPETGLYNGEEKKLPTLLYCQGGPESAVSQFWSTRWNIAIMQANGYAVVLPNRHGVPGFGQAFNEQIAGDFAGQCMRDYFTAIDQVAATEPWCDKDRLGAVGASFGGYSVYWLAGHHQKRFKTFIAHCGIFNCESMYGETEEMWFADWDYGGAYFGQCGLQPGLCHTPKRGSGINACYTDSPHKSITKWDTPILVIHNELDYRIPVTQGMQAFNLARMRGIPARFLYFPDECHWVTKPQNAVLWQRVFFNWLDTYLKDKPQEEPAEITDAAKTAE